MIRSTADSLTLTVEMENRDALFQARNPDPFRGGPLFESGFDQIYEELVDQTPRKPLTLVFYLPARHLTDELETEIRYGLEQRCLHEEDTIARERRALRREGLKALQSGIVFLLLCLLGAYFLQQANPFPDFLNFFFREGLFILGWVGMWRPVDILLHEWWPQVRAKQIFQAIRQARVVVEARESAWMRECADA